MRSTENCGFSTLMLSTRNWPLVGPASAILTSTLSAFMKSGVLAISGLATRTSPSFTFGQGNNDTDWPPDRHRTARQFTAIVFDIGTVAVPGDHMRRNKRGRNGEHEEDAHKRPVTSRFSLVQHKFNRPESQRLTAIIWQRFCLDS